MEKKDRDNLFSDLEEIKLEVHMIKKILNGNGVPGLVAKVARHEEHLQLIRGRELDIGTFLFRAIIGAAISFIAWKVTGFKP